MSHINDANDTAVIPGGCTGFIQAADVVWKVKPPSHATVCEWVRASWDTVPPDAVKESFLYSTSSVI